MNTYVISWISFFHNNLIMEKVQAENYTQSLHMAFEKLAGNKYDGDDSDTDNIKQAAFDCNGMIEAIMI